MEIRLLGPIDVRDGGRTVALPRRQQRALLAALALRAGEVVSTDRLVADLWGERAPASATGSLQNTVSALRKALGRDVVLTQAPGYRLALDPDSVDAHRFEGLLAAARAADEPARATLLSEALGLWRGPALADLDEEEFARLAAGRLDELRVTALEERVDAELALGRHASLVGELETLVAAHPLRERLRGQLMLALYRCGRQAEALEVYRAARLALADELGLDPSPELQELERRVLRQDPSLEPPARAEEAPVERAAERRLVTVLAALPPGDEDPERHRRRLDDTLADVRGALARNGGTLERFGPEGLVAVFGAEAPSDDDAHRALATAEEVGLPAGIATGEVVGGAGPVVNRAVELARSGGIALDERTQALVAETRRLDRPLVGREDELARLEAALRADGCSVVTVVGEPGIGKTRLARDLARRAGEGTTVLVARCVSYGQGATFLPFLGALRRAEPERALAGEEDAKLVLARLAALADGREPTSLGESYWAVRRLLEALSPALLILDDVHWAEPALLDLVDYLGERTQGSLLVLCLSRPELERPLGEALELGPLDDEHARAIVPPELDAKIRDRIVGLAEGNALYIEQLSSYATEGGESLPPTLAAVLAGRLGRLEEAERAVLQRAAVVGREFSRGAVAALAEQPVDAALSSLSRRGFVHPSAAADPGDDGYRFHHILLHDAAYASLTKADRADLHKRAATWIDRDGRGDDALAGYHQERAVRYRRELGEDADELAATAGERLGEAGMRAWRQNDTSAAIGLLERSVALLPAGERRAELLWELAVALRLAGRPPDADAALARAQREARDASADAIVSRVAVERARVALLAGELELADAAEATDSSIAKLARARDSRGLGRARLSIATIHGIACDFASQEAAATLAISDYADAGFSPAACYSSLANALYYGPRPVDEGMRRCAELLQASPDRATKANVTAVLGALHGLKGDVTEARALLSHARSTFEDLGSRSPLETILAPLAVDVERMAGHIEEATRLCLSSFDTLEAAGDRAFAATRAIRLAELLLEVGRTEDAKRYVEIAEKHVIRSDVLVQFLLRSQRARLLSLQGRRSEAVALAREATAISSLTDALLDRAKTHTALAEVLAAAGRHVEAKRESAETSRLLAEKGLNARESLLGSLSLA